MDRAATVDKLRTVASQLREDIVTMLAEAGSGHPGGSLSVIDLVNALFNAEMRHRPEEPTWPGRDRFILSKGHAVPALYVTLAQQGYIDRAQLATLRQLGSPLQGHPSNLLVPGVEAPSGSLGQGLSIALGFALAAKLDGDAFRSYAIIGDGEMQEGQIWEAAMSAAKYKLDTLCVFLDYNRAQIDGFVRDVMPIDPVEDKWRAFGWHVLTINGHDYDQILDALDEAKRTKGKPTFIVARTLKGKGVPLFEADMVKWHGNAPSKAEAEQAIAALRRGTDTTSW